MWPRGGHAAVGARVHVSRRPLLRGVSLTKGGGGRYSGRQKAVRGSSKVVQWAAEGGARRRGGRGVVCASA
jgi:hypothetical protein